MGNRQGHFSSLAGQTPPLARETNISQLNMQMIINAMRDRVSIHLAGYTGPVYAFQSQQDRSSLGPRKLTETK